MGKRQCRPATELSAFRCAIDAGRRSAHHYRMASPCPTLRNGSRLVVGSMADPGDLQSMPDQELATLCDLLEMRLDLLEDGFLTGENRPWLKSSKLPLLFTARRPEEGGGGNLAAKQRESLLRDVLGEASLIDLEVASLEEMPTLVEDLLEHGLPWLASYHDFEQLPDPATLSRAATEAREAGAHVFKLAAHLPDAASLARLLEFQLADHGVPVATMGMGPLAPASRLLCAQAGSVLNYGHLGGKPTAPGQWSAKQLKRSIDCLADWPS